MFSVGPLADALSRESAPPAPSRSARQAAVLVLLDPADSGGTDGGSIVYTRRQATLSSHPSQISFPGGRVDPGEGRVEAALREASEEIGLDAGSVEVLGLLPAFYVAPSRFWMSTVVGVWRAPHRLVPNPAEVAEVLHVDLATLRSPERWRAVHLSSAGRTWAWDLGPSGLLWGATAVVTGAVLDLMDPGWSGGQRPLGLDDSLLLRPWEEPTAAGLAPPRGSRPARLGGLGTLQVEAPGAADGAAAVEPAGRADLERWAAAVAAAVTGLLRRPPGPVVVLCGTGVVGGVGRAAAEVLREAGEEVVVVDVGGRHTPETLDEELVGAAVVVDAILGRGLSGPVQGPLAAAVRALRHVGAPIIAVDLPSGMHARDGLVGEAVSADVTVTGMPLTAGHVAPGALPFVADLYVVDSEGLLRRALVVERPPDWAE